MTAHGFGKRTSLPEYPTKGRGTGGVITIKLRPKDEIASAQVVYETSLLTFITTKRSLSSRFMPITPPAGRPIGRT